MTAHSVLVTGASGYIGSRVVRALAAERGDVKTIVAMDVRPVEGDGRLDGVDYEAADIRSPDVAAVIERYAIDTVVHLVAIVSPVADRDFEYDVDVNGTRNVLDACVGGGVEKLIITSSGAAYGYHADNPDRLDETDALRGNPEFAYSDHKRIVEEMLAEYREAHPELAQLVFRPGTVLGAGAANQITDLFDKPVALGVAGTETPWVLIWDADLVNCITKGIHEDRTGIYNVAGDGVITTREMAKRMRKPYIPIPARVLEAALAVLGRFGLTQYGPEQVDFLRYRPVLGNRRLKEEFGYEPALSSAEVFDRFLESRRQPSSARRRSR